MRRVLLAVAIFTFLACGGHQPVTIAGPGTTTKSEAVRGDDAASNVAALVGTWRGTSICTPIRPACRDEIAVYHIAASADPNMIAMTMNKVVNGEEVEMGGTLNYAIDYSARTLSHEILARDGTRALFGFTWSGTKMSGTLIQLPGREVVRNIQLEKTSE